MSNNNGKASATLHTVSADDPIEIRAVQEHAPWWPFKVDTTYRLVRNGELRAIAIGRRRYVTLALLREFLQRHTSAVANGDNSSSPSTPAGTAGVAQR